MNAFEIAIKQGKELQSELEKAAVLRQLRDSYEFLCNVLGRDHAETKDCWLQIVRVGRT